jgi:monoamine oxidase
VAGFFDGPLSRRHFLRRLGVAVGATLGTSPLAELAAVAAPAPVHVVIAGAGLAGLCAALELERRGHTCTILEAETRHVGGRARTLRFEGGLYGEAGAMRVPKSHTLTRHYVAELGLTLRPFVQSNPDDFMFMRGRRERVRDVTRLGAAYGLTPAEQGRSPEDLWAASFVKRLQGLSNEERQDLFAMEPRTEAVRALDHLSVRRVLEAESVSAEAIEFLSVGLGVDTLLDDAASEALREESQAVWSQSFDEIVGGTDRLPAAMAAQLRDRPRMGCEVVRLEQDPLRGKAAAVYREAGRLRRAEGDFLLCTLPFPVLARVESSPDSPGPSGAPSASFTTTPRPRSSPRRRGGSGSRTTASTGAGPSRTYPPERPGIPATTRRRATPRCRRRRVSSWPRTAGGRRRGAGRRCRSASGASRRSVTSLACILSWSAPAS